MNVPVRVPCRAGSAWNSGACSTVKFGVERRQLAELGPDEHVPHERHVPRVRRHVAHAQAIARGRRRSRDPRTNSSVARRSGTRARRRAAASKFSGAYGWLTLPQSMSSSDAGSRTTNLSFGERPVCGAVTATNGPMSANSPSPRRAAACISSGATRFQWTAPVGRSPCCVESDRCSRAHQVAR